MCSYFNQFVASVIVNNQPIRELNKNNRRTCLIPFGSEYKIRLKNYNSFRAKVEIYIDGTDILFGEKLVLNPKQTLDLERFLSSKDGGNKFKFVSVDQAAQSGELNDPNNYDNGHIQIKFYKEVEYTIVSTSSPYSTHHYYNPSPFIKSPTQETFPWTPHIYCSSVGTIPTSQITLTSGVTINATNSANTTGTLCASNASISNVNGVTLEGNISDQKFYEISDFITEQNPSIIDIWLEGKQCTTKLSPFEDFIFPAFEFNSTDIQINRAKEWLEKSFIHQLDKNLHSVLQIFIIPILTNKNSSLDDRVKAKNWLTAFNK